MAYEVRLAPPARRALGSRLPEVVAAACFAFLSGPLAENPHRVGTQMTGTFARLYSARRGEYRVTYRIEQEAVVNVVIASRHRRHAYR
ncbi:toxin RelE [Mobilicoccus caccae]|uniref:Toxin RelE n=1 Tax=Mobilicoccus caccae TaxID=1859295 RepID=A0ABQ6ITE1_9MICO|nr:toxin RelE [Mobilicoccus caccae]